MAIARNNLFKGRMQSYRFKLSGLNQCFGSAKPFLETQFKPYAEFTILNSLTDPVNIQFKPDFA